MIAQFYDQTDDDAHDRFQQWRQTNGDGFFVNCKSEKKGMLHQSLCHHPGETDLKKEALGSLTRNRKVASTKREELITWARERDVALTFCHDCKP